MSGLLEVAGLTKRFVAGGVRFAAVDDVSLGVALDAGHCVSKRALVISAAKREQRKSPLAASDQRCARGGPGAHVSSALRRWASRAASICSAIAP